MTVTHVYGPPCAGKTSYVRGVARDGDLIWDQDEILRALGCSRPSSATSEQLRMALALRNRFLDTVERGVEVPAVWVISCSPTEAERRELMQGIHHEEVALETHLDVCLARLRQQRRPQHTIEYASEWWQRYERTW